MAALRRRSDELRSKETSYDRYLRCHAQHIRDDANRSNETHEAHEAWVLRCDAQRKRYDELRGKEDIPTKAKRVADGRKYYKDNIVVIRAAAAKYRDLKRGYRDNYEYHDILLRMMHPDLAGHRLSVENLNPIISNILTNKNLMRLDKTTLQPTQELLNLFGGLSFRRAMTSRDYAACVGSTGREYTEGLELEALRWLITGGNNRPVWTWPCGRLIKDWEAYELLEGDTI